MYDCMYDDCLYIPPRGPHTLPAAVAVAVSAVAARTVCEPVVPGVGRHAH
jgi:uncharacterized RmlC-like cupin family protein